MKDNKFLNFNIQLFAEEADNADEIDTEVEEDLDVEEDLEDELDESDPVDADGEEENEPIDKTKAFSNRLKEKTKEIEEKYNKKSQEKLDNIAKIRGFKNWEEFENANQRDTLIEAGVEDPDKFKDILDKMIKENPEVVKARQIIEEQEARERDLAVEDEIKLIQKLNPSINSLEDISKEENCQEVIDRINKGYSLYDAYVLSNLDKINSINNEKAKKSAINNAQSKSHMKNSRGTSTSSVEVPKDIYNTYRKNLPSWSDKQIKEHYAKSIGGN